MRVPVFVVAALASLIAAPSARAQDAARMSAADITAACAPPVGSSRAQHTLRIAGAQDTVPRTVLGRADLLIVNGGSGAGVQLGSMFFLRHASTTVQTTGKADAADVVTDAWVRIIAVSDASSVAQVDHLCGPIYVNDYLEPFAPPRSAAAAEGAVEPDFTSLGRVVSGSDGHTLTGINQTAILDRGSQQGLQEGSRFAIYRDLTSGVDPLLAAPAGTPLTVIGEGVVLSSTGDRAIARIVRARDAVRVGDYVAPAKQP